jgi:hypothetical protein
MTPKYTPTCVFTKRWGSQSSLVHSKDKRQTSPFFGQYFDGGSLDRRAALRPRAIARLERVIGTLN